MTGLEHILIRGKIFHVKYVSLKTVIIDLDSVLAKQNVTVRFSNLWQNKTKKERKEK